MSIMGVRYYIIVIDPEVGWNVLQSIISASSATENQLEQKEHPSTIN